MELKCKQFVKVSDTLGPMPYCIQWAIWCWRRPIYIGIPLLFLSIVLMVVDAILGLWYLLTHWGKL